MWYSKFDEFFGRKTWRKIFDCPQNIDAKTKSRWCSSCRSSSFDTKFCQSNNAAKSVKTALHYNSYLLKISFENDCAENVFCNKISVDCGATVISQTILKS